MSTPRTGSIVFDPTPLTEHVDSATLRDWARGPGREVLSPSLKRPWLAPLMVIVSLFIFGGIVMATMSGGWGFGTSLFTAQSVGDVLTGLIVTLPPLVFIAVLVTAVILVITKTRSRRLRAYRLDRFARANGMSYLVERPQPRLPGMIFNIGGSREATDIVRGSRPRLVEIANYQYTTESSDDNKTIHRWGYVAIKLDVPLPNIVLDAKSNNLLFGSNLPISLKRRQRLSLEGDFDKHFTLYCPEGYETDALYLFTPDIMTRFIDHAAALDVEIVDDWLFFYAKRDLSTLDPETWAWLFSTVHALLDKFGQWARWRDERLRVDAAAHAETHTAAMSPSDTLEVAAVAAATAVPVAQKAAVRPPPGVAKRGQRLRRGISWPVLVVCGVFVLAWVGLAFGALMMFTRG